MDYSTKITKRLVKECMTDVGKIMVDWRDAPRNKRKKNRYWKIQINKVRTNNKLSITISWHKIIIRGN